MEVEKNPGKLSEDILNRDVCDARQLQARLDAGDDPNHPERCGDRPLHRAARNLDGRCVGLLLAAGADPLAVGERNMTPLHWAAIGQTWPKAAELLIAAGARLDARDKYGSTPLHLAAAYSKGTECRIVASLLALGADPSALDNEGRTPAEKSETDEARDMILRAAEAAALAGSMANPSKPNRSRRMSES